MRKIFSAALALVCIWFATPSWANCNLFDGQIEKGSIDLNNGSVLVDNEDRTRSKNFIAVQPNTQYVFTRENTNGIRWIVGYDKDKNPITDSDFDRQHLSAIKNMADGKANSTTFTTTPTTYYIRWYNTSNSGLSEKVQIERGDTATEYTPYNPLCATCNGTIVNYTSATGTGVQSGTPTPTNPIEPTFYKQGNMILRKVGNYADSYDATTGKITRRVGVKVLDGTENWQKSSNYTGGVYLNPRETYWVTNSAILCTHFEGMSDTNHYARGKMLINNGYLSFWYGTNADTSVDDTKTFLASQYAAGTPVTVWYPLAEETTENWTESQYCNANEPIKIATTKYNETKFSPLNTALQQAISVVDTVVSNTITQAGRIATLQAQKQTRPNDIADDNEKCPAGKKCLLVEDASGVPHWYEIVESILRTDYTELEYIKSTGTQYIDTGITLTNDVSYVANIGTTKDNVAGTTGIIWQSGFKFQIRYYSNETFNITDGFGLYAINTLYNVDFNVDKTHFCKDDLCVTKTRDIVPNSTRIKTGVYDMIASLKIYDNGTLVRDFVPVKRKIDDAVGLYDTVNNRFYTNVGDGEFTAGPVAE